MARRGKRKNKNNFSLADYIYLKYDDFVNSDELRNVNAVNRNNKIKKVQKHLEDNFKNQTGYTVKEFMEVLRSNITAVSEINKLFNQPTVKDYLDLKNDKEISSFLSKASDLEILKTTGFVISSTTLLNKIFANKSDANEVLDTITALKDIGSLDQVAFAAMVRKLKGDRDAALSYKLMDMILEKSNNILLEKDSSGTYRAKAIKDFEVTNYFPTLDKHWSIVKSEMARSTPDTAKINKELKKVLDIINRYVKGKNLGELSGKIILSPIIDDLVSKNVEEKVISIIEHTATKPNQNVSFKVTPKVKTGKEVIFSLEIEDDALGKVIQGFAEGAFKEMVSDVTANLTLGSDDSSISKKMGMSVKTLKVDAKKVVLSNSVSIAAALKLANTPESREILESSGTNRRAVFLNAMNFALAKANFLQNTKDPFKIRYTTASQGRFSIAQLDKLTKGVLSDVAIDIYSSMFNSEVAALIDINGMILPTPLYFKYVMEHFRRNEKTTGTNAPITNIIEFKGEKSSSSYRSRIVKGGSADQEKYRIYSVLAGTRNGYALKSIFEQTVNIKAYYIKPNEYYKIMLKK